MPVGALCSNSRSPFSRDFFSLAAALAFLSLSQRLRLILSYLPVLYVITQLSTEYLILNFPADTIKHVLYSIAILGTHLVVGYTKLLRHFSSFLLTNRPISIYFISH